jgi:hypothetical protein
MFSQALRAARPGSAEAGCGMPVAVSPAPGQYFAHGLPEGRFAHAAEFGRRPADDSYACYWHFVSFDAHLLLVNYAPERRGCQ